MINENAPLVKQYRNWLQASPQAFVMFERMANEIRGSGFNRYSAKTIVEAIRWHSDLERTEAFKINNNYVALLAIDLISKDASFEGFFEMRRTKAF